MITNPENLTKDRLKSELKKKGVVFNNEGNKKYYVDLYRKKILNPDPVRSEFSDDDFGSSPGLSKRKPPRMRKSKKEAQVIFISNLSDEELMDELIEYGENPGPINSLTRSVYERKLIKVMEEEGTPRKHPLPVKETESVNDSFIGEWSDEGDESDDGEEEEDGGGAEPSPVTTPSHSSSYNLRRRDIPSEKPSRSSRVPASQTLSVPSRRSPRPSGRPQASSDTCRTLWSFFLLLMVFLMVFLLYEHVTVPDGKMSLLSSGCDAVHSILLGMMAPLMERQEVEPGSASAEPPPDKPAASDPPVPKEEAPTPAPPTPKPEEDLPKEELPKEELPKEELPKEELPKEDLPEEAPVKPETGADSPPPTNAPTAGKDTPPPAAETPKKVPPKQPKSKTGNQAIPPSGKQS